METVVCPQFFAQFFAQFFQTGLHYNYFRDYDPLSGRYIQSDPIGLLGGINTYIYANNNSIKHIDPSGLLFGSFVVCEAANAAYAGYSVASDLNNYDASNMEMIQDQIDLLNERIEKDLSQCSDTDTKELNKISDLMDIRNRLTEIKLNSVSEAYKDKAFMSMQNVGMGMVGAGACGAALLLPF